MIYGNVVCGYLETATEETGKPVTMTPFPTAPSGYTYKLSWVDEGDTITQTWTLIEQTDLTDSEILAILLGEGEEE